MKKILAVLLAVMLVLFLFVAEAAAESGQPVLPVQIDLTKIVIAVLFFVFDFLLVWLIKAVIPPAKKWLDAHATKNQQQVLWNLIKRLVEGAEQMIAGEGRGEEKLRYVIDKLKERGYLVDRYLIEAAVKEMNDKLLYAFEDGFGFLDDDDNEETPPNDDSEGIDED